MKIVCEHENVEFISDGSELAKCAHGTGKLAGNAVFPVRAGRVGNSQIAGGRTVEGKEKKKFLFT